MKKVTIYTDGACSFNPGPGGWGCVLLYNNIEKSFSGFEKETTNNRMEMQAVIEALSRLKEHCEIDLYSDSAYIVNAFQNNWIDSWQKKNWKTSDNKEVKNIDLWLKILELSSKHKINWFKVKGHADNVYNNKCDTLARGEVDKYLDTIKKEV